MPHGEYKTPGGKLVVVDCDVRDGRLVDVEVSGDFFLEPAEALDAITAALDGMPADLDEDAIARRVAGAVAPDVEMIGFTPASIANAVRRALA
ncbi:MAG TPA: biotin--protein ligase [Thermomicrobiaceae bacterium]|nr:biotin--protein ligase [Thermomicrobiaceae bacterium]